MRRLLLGAPLLALAAALSPPSVATASSWRLTTAITTVDALERTAGERPHGLLDGMYDPETGLCSEGVWHNAWLGVSRVLISRELRAAAEAMEEAEEVATVRLADRQLAAARTLGASLHTLSFDGRGFRRRTPSGFWEAAADASAAISAAGEDPLFYMPSDEHRCVSSASAIILYSMLAEEEEEHGSETPSARAILAQAGDGFVSEFFDDAACRFRRTGSTDGGEGEGAPYWRAVDQAMGCLACLRLARLGHDAARTRAMATCAADSLLREFGYSLYATEGVPPGTYLGRVASRNSWHDTLSCFALLASGSLGVGGESAGGLVRSMMDSYRGPSATSSAIRHRPRELASSTEEEPVSFSSTQALWSAVVRAASGTDERVAGSEADLPALRAWYDEQHIPANGLLPVADVYPTARLWANTEWAAWLLLDQAEFTTR